MTTLPKWVTVSEYARCRYCGAENLAWLKSRAGKWYLANTRQTDWGRIEACPRDWHTCAARSKPRAAECAPQWLHQVISAGYRALALKHHPDHGGTTADMQQINAAVERLRAVIR